ncbi:hypothetical protein IW140_005420 [Coemansia sp. RSA 1813]|nr:hypothetical protein EV178_005378 [Coemansia sp. RSA 1646]KAJ1767729.1 hypothetical protein LPJ74_005203 [Coemansia sp. RSA 1843]KAJ2086832.1 hypothetical protein IW138_005399 [Coemansia sp. RSA 986]KAJ2211597.1 hypothetical protein EV179_005363 [Coemansia sp. RSA 487]KAJ2565209.1 hypothetical protein IW140_005420 [Coemansia sp. RSA 1813]
MTLQKITDSVGPSSQGDEALASKRPRTEEDDDSSYPTDTPLSKTALQTPKKIGGRSRPAPLVLMFEPVVIMHQQQSTANVDEINQDDIRPETRSLGLLLVDPETNDYAEPELHDCRVRCVFDSIETRGIVYRAKRMAAKLAHYLQIDRTRYIQVYRHRMQALRETKAYNDADMQTIRGHLAMLESEDSVYGSSLDAHDKLVAPNSQSIIDHGALRIRTTERDVQEALIRLKSRFSLSLDVVTSAEFHAFCKASYMAQRDGTVDRPLSITADSYLDAVDRSVVERRLLTVRQQIGSAKHGGGYSVILYGYHYIIGVFVSSAQQPASSLFELVPVDDAQTVADKVSGCLARLNSAMADEMAKANSNKPQLISIVTAGTALGLHLLDVPIVHPDPLFPTIRTGCTTQMLRTVASSLLSSRHMYTEENGSFSESKASIVDCSMSLIEVARAIVTNEETQNVWTTKHQALVLPSTPMSTASYFRLFQQMVSVDYEFLLQLKDSVDNTASHQYFDILLDHGRAPMFLALVQMFALLNWCITLTTEQPFTMADLAVLLARLEATLEMLASGGIIGSAPTDEMQAVARYVLSEFRAAIAVEFGGKDDCSPLYCMLLAHSLSLYPRDDTVRTSFMQPLSSSQLLETARRLLQFDAINANGLHLELSMPELYLQWAEFHTKIDSICGGTHLDELPSSFSVRKVMELVGLFSTEQLDRLGPMVSLSTILNEIPVSASALDDMIPNTLDGLTDMELKELEISVADKLKPRSLVTGGTVSVAHSQTRLLTCVADYNEAPIAGAAEDPLTSQQGIIAVWDIGPDDAPIDRPPDRNDEFAHSKSNCSLSLLLRYFDPPNLQSLTPF